MTAARCWTQHGVLQLQQRRTLCRRGLESGGEWCSVKSRCVIVQLAAAGGEHALATAPAIR